MAADAVKCSSKNNNNNKWQEGNETNGMGNCVSSGNKLNTKPSPSFEYRDAGHQTCKPSELGLGLVQNTGASCLGLGQNPGSIRKPSSTTSDTKPFLTDVTGSQLANKGKNRATTPTGLGFNAISSSDVIKKHVAQRSSSTGRCRPASNPGKTSDYSENNRRYPTCTSPYANTFQYQYQHTPASKLHQLASMPNRSVVRTSRADTMTRRCRACPSPSPSSARGASTMNMHEMVKKHVPPMARSVSACKDCKVPAGPIETVCFISNDGKVTATNVAASSLHLHHCNSTRCAANPNYNPASHTPNPKKVLVSRNRSPLPSSMKYKSKPSSSDVIVRRSVVGSTNIHRSDMDNIRIRRSDVGSTDIRRSDMDNIRIRRSDVGSADIRQSDLYNTDNHQTDICQSDVGTTNIPQSDVKNIDIHQSNAHTTEIRRSDANIMLTEQLDADIIDIRRSDSNGHQSKMDVKDIVNALACSDQDVSLSRPSMESEKTSSSYSDDPSYSEELKAEDVFLKNDDGKNKYYSCSEDGNSSDIATTPISSVLNSSDFGDGDLQKLHAAARMEKMRKKFLSALTEQEAETVRLRKQETLSRKQAGDWMLDCAMEEMLHKLAPSGEARVKVIVEAFETIMHHTDVEGSNLDQTNEGSDC